MICFRFDGQGEDEDGPAAVLVVLSPRASTMSLNDRARYRQTHAPPTGFHRDEGFEDLVGHAK